MRTVKDENVCNYSAKLAHLAHNHCVILQQPQRRRRPRREAKKQEEDIEEEADRQRDTD